MALRSDLGVNLKTVASSKATLCAALSAATLVTKSPFEAIHMSVVPESRTSKMLAIGISGLLSNMFAFANRDKAQFPGWRI